MSSSSSEDNASFYDPAGGEDDRDVAALERSAAAEDEQLNVSTPNIADFDARQRTRSTDSRKARARQSLPEPIPAVPAIPEHLLATGKPATLLQRRKGGVVARKEQSKPLNAISSPTLHIQQASISGDIGVKQSAPRSPHLLSPRVSNDINKRAPPNADLRTRRKSLPALPAQAHAATLDKLQGAARGIMNRFGKGRKEDLFLELANDDASGEERPPSRSERATSRLSFANKRRSLPAQVPSSSSADVRPRTSGAIFGQRPPSRHNNQPSELHRHVERYRNVPSRASFQADDAVSVSARSRPGLPQRYSDRPTTSPSLQQAGPRSPELPSFGRRRPSLSATSQSAEPRMISRQQDAHSESPAEDAGPGHSFQESSAESEAEDTVWDELDDLKSRIKKLEITGKLPPTFVAAGSNESSDRPRTATTAPTTIDSSPKHSKQEKKSEPGVVVEVDPDDEPPANTSSGPDISNIHPNLHSALAKAKPLLNGSLYRSLEATAVDALQLAAMTGSAGPQGTAYSAAAIINGVTVSDRHVRRKADTMCRNLTDLCLALCEGKHEAHSIVASPVTLSTPAQQSPTIRLPRSSLEPNPSISRSRSGGRPMSRLEARRTSILGSQAGSSIGNSPGLSGGEELSASEQEGTPSNIRISSLRRQDRSTSRLQASRLRERYNETADDDEDPTIRPASRAMTDFNRTKPIGPRDYASNTTPQRSPSLRDSLVMRRASANAAAYESNSRVASSGHRRFHDPSTPPVLEEEGGVDEYQTTPSNMSAQSKRRIMSLGPYSSRRTMGEAPSRHSSLNQRRHIAVE